jgi:hypothetical protein
VNSDSEWPGIANTPLWTPSPWRVKDVRRHVHDRPVCPPLKPYSSELILEVAYCIGNTCDQRHTYSRALTNILERGSLGWLLMPASLNQKPQRRRAIMRNLRSPSRSNSVYNIESNPQGKSYVVFEHKAYPLVYSLKGI